MSNGQFVATTNGDGESEHVLDAYVYHHPAADELRCLALSRSGAVHEGIVTVLDGGLELELEGHAEDETVSRVVRVTFEAGGSPRARLWSGDGARETPNLDVQFERN